MKRDGGYLTSACRTVVPCTDVDELEGGYGHLQEGTTARLPLLMLDGALLFFRPARLSATLLCLLHVSWQIDQHISRQAMQSDSHACARVQLICNTVSTCALNPTTISRVCGPMTEPGKQFVLCAELL
jgi:hypothetical protein